MKNIFKTLLLIFFWTSFSGQLCTKALVYGKDYYTQPKKETFQNGRQEVMDAVKKSLEKYTYQIQNVDETNGRVTCGWRPVEADSHYVNLFGRKDYGLTDGAYYQLVVDLQPEGSGIKVLVGTTIKSIAGPMASTGKVEGRILAQLENLLRSPQIEMTNVGVEKK